MGPECYWFSFFSFLGKGVADGNFTDYSSNFIVESSKAKMFVCFIG